MTINTSNAMISIPYIFILYLAKIENKDESAMDSVENIRRGPGYFNLNIIYFGVVNRVEEINNEINRKHENVRMI